MTRGRDRNTAHLVAETLEEARAQWIDVFSRDRADLGPGHAAQTAAEDIERYGPQATAPQPPSSTSAPRTAVRAAHPHPSLPRPRPTVARHRPMTSSDEISRTLTADGPEQRPCVTTRGQMPTEEVAPMNPIQIPRSGPTTDSSPSRSSAT